MPRSSNAFLIKQENIFDPTLQRYSNADGNLSILAHFKELTFLVSAVSNRIVKNTIKNSKTQDGKVEKRHIVLYLMSSAGVGGSVAWLPNRITGFLARLTSSMHFCTFVLKANKTAKHLKTLA